VNGGNSNGVGTTRAGFYGPVSIPLFVPCFGNNLLRQTITTPSKTQIASTPVSALPRELSSTMLCVEYLITDAYLSNQVL
jgi:hypothetical protein